MATADTRALRAHVRARAEGRCEYCHLPEEIVPHGLWIDHIIPIAKGGTNEHSNLCVSCVSCNQTKGTGTQALDPATQKEITLFNPRKDIWKDHFKWSPDRTQIEGLTSNWTSDNCRSPNEPA